jgi:hypothetical protein
VNRRRRDSTRFPLLMLWLVILSAGGCGVAVPTRPAVEVKRGQPVEIGEDAVVSLGPRRLLEELSGEIAKQYPDIEVVDGLLFRDTAFPEGGWNLATLFESGAGRRVSDALDVDYLVLVGAAKTKEGEEKGFLVPLLAGAMSVESSTTLSAMILDLRSGEQMSRIECRAHGTSRMVYYVIFIAGTGPMSLQSGAAKGLAGEIGKVITELSPPGKHRVAVLALEHPGDTGETTEAGAEGVLADATVRGEIYAHRSNEELRAVAKKGSAACHGEAEVQLQHYFDLVKTDPMAAHRLLCQSADQGHPEARYRLALIYENGSEGFAPDPVQAYLWYVLAGESGKYQGGQQALRLKQEVLGPAQLAEAQQAVQAWRPGQCEHQTGLPVGQKEK